MEETKGVIMHYRIEEEGNTLRRIAVEFSEQECQQAEEEAIKAIQPEIQIAGFRKGKVPADIIRKRFPGLVHNEVLEILARRSLQEIPEIQEWKVVAPPKVVEHREIDNGGMLLVIETEVLPEFEIDDRYKELKIKDIPPLEENEAVERTIQGLLKEHGEKKAAETVEDEQSIVTLEMRETDEAGIPILGSSQEPIQVSVGEIGDENLRKQLIGKAKGAELHYQLPDQEGKMRNYQIRITDVQIQEPARLDEEFIKKISGGQLSTQEQLREHIRQILTAQYQRDRREILERQIIDQIVDKYEDEIPVPASLVEQLLRKRLEEAQIPADSVPPEQLEALRKAVRRGVVWSLVEQKLIEKEGITVSEEEIQNSANSTAQHFGIPVEHVLAQLRDTIEEQLLRQKLIDRLIEIAEIEEAEQEISDQESEIMEGEDKNA